MCLNREWIRNVVAIALAEVCLLPNIVACIPQDINNLNQCRQFQQLIFSLIYAVFIRPTRSTSDLYLAPITVHLHELKNLLLHPARSYTSSPVWIVCPVLEKSLKKTKTNKNPE